MSPADIAAELFTGASLSQVEIDWFRGQGVPVMALAKPLAAGTDRVLFRGVGFEFARYRASDEAEIAVIIPGYDEWGELADLCAWQPRMGAIGTWLGRVGLLGEEQVFGPRFGPLMIYPDPLGWLRAGREGVAVINRKRAAPLLRDTGHLAVSSVEQGERLRKMLAVPLPRVLVGVPDPERAAA